MTEHTEEEIGDDDFPIFTTNLNHLIDRGYSPMRYAAALDAAWEAVIAKMCDCGCEGVVVEDAIYAIDALREEKP